MTLYLLLSLKETLCWSDINLNLSIFTPFLRLNFLAALRLTVIPIEILFWVQKKLLIKENLYTSAPR